MSKTTVYLAGPMRGYKDFNFPAFLEAAAVLRELGMKVLSPAEHDLEIGLDPTNPDLDAQGFDLEASMAWDLGAVLKSDAVVVLPGWHPSTGVGHEVAVARCTGKPVLDFDTLMPAEEEPVTAEACRLVHGARQGSYGHPYDDFSRTGVLWAGLLANWAMTVEDPAKPPPIPPHLVGLCQVGVKLSREVNSHKRDNLVDIGGYAETVNLVYERAAELAAKL